MISFILYQYHHQHVTQPLLLKQLQDLGVDISSGRLSQLITDGLEMFHDEKDPLLRTGLSVSQYSHTDDTGARHNGKNNYCTPIGNELFAWFSSTESKSRINFLCCLGQNSRELYVFDHALCWIHAERIINRLIPLNDEHVKAVDNVREQIWLLYRDLKGWTSGGI